MFKNTKQQKNNLDIDFFFFPPDFKFQPQIHKLLYKKKVKDSWYL